MSKSKAIMQIQLDQDSDKTVNDLMEYAMTLSDALGLDTDSILKEMCQDSTAHLILTFNKYFGEYVELLESDQFFVSKTK